MKPSPELLSPGNHALILIDSEGEMAFATKSIDIMTLRNNAGLVVDTPKIFDVATIVTTVAEESLSGPVFPKIEEAYPQARAGYIDRSSMNTWKDQTAYDVIKSKGKQKLVFAGLWTNMRLISSSINQLTLNS